MDMLELECPNCKEVLELDIGFAGGVCRCSNCSILMTVPENPEAERAEKLNRPDVPGGPAANGIDPDASSNDPASVLAAATQLNTGTYTTESGKSVQINEDTYIPTARKKRPGVRATVVLVFAASMSAIVAVCIFAIMILIHGAPEQAWQPDAQDFLSAYNPKQNPFKITQPNMVGLPIGTKTVTVIDTSSTSRSWLGIVKDMVLSGTDFEMTEMRFQVVMGNDDGAEIFPDHSQPLIDLDQSDLKQFLRNYIALGQADLAAAVDKALADEPKQIILITGRELNDTQVGSIRKILDVAPETQFDVMLIDTKPSESLLKLVEQHNGLCEKISADQLQQWYNQTL